MVPEPQRYPMPPIGSRTFQLKLGRTSAPRLPQAVHTNRGSISESRTSSAQASALTYKFDVNDPSLQAARAMAHSKGWTQQDFSEALAIFASHVAGQEFASPNAPAPSSPRPAPMNGLPAIDTGPQSVAMAEAGLQ